MNDGSSSQVTPTRLSVSGSGLGSSSGSTLIKAPLPQDEKMVAVFRDFFEAALAFDVLKYSVLLERYPAIRVFGMMKEKERVAEIVHKMTGIHLKLVLKRFDILRYADDVSAMIEDDPELSKMFVSTVGLEFFQDVMTPLDIYNAIMGTAWMMQPTPTHRGFAAQSCEILVRHNAFGTNLETLHAIEKAISLDVLFSDKTPEELRLKMIRAINKGCRNYGGHYICEYMFDPAIGGVSFMDLAKHLPLDVMGSAFAVYINRLGILDTKAEAESVLPPAGDDARMSGFQVPRPPALPPRLPSPGDSDTNSR